MNRAFGKLVSVTDDGGLRITVALPDLSAFLHVDVSPQEITEATAAAGHELVWVPGVGFRGTGLLAEESLP